MSISREHKDMIALTDFCIALSVEKKLNNGEDSEAHSINKNAVFFGVFDGCGGSGAQSCPKLQGKTEAYIASRIVAKVFQQWFEDSDIDFGWKVNSLKDQIVKCLKKADALYGEASKLLGGMKKKFPTTAAAGICYSGKDTIEVDLFWAGDSRVYLLTPQGLAQLTEDDLGGIDAMENLKDDGVLTNVISLSKDFSLHVGHISAESPCIIFAATDGCFGYLSTPMEFEYLLLESLLNSDCVSSDRTGVSTHRLEQLSEKGHIGWQESLMDVIGRIAGDDYTISGYAFGFDSFSEMKKAFIPRANALYRQFISNLSEKSYVEKYDLWLKYRDNYHRYICHT